MFYVTNRLHDNKTKVHNKSPCPSTFCVQHIRVKTPIFGTQYSGGGGIRGYALRKGVGTVRKILLYRKHTSNTLKRYHFHSETQKRDISIKHSQTNVCKNDACHRLYFFLLSVNGNVEIGYFCFLSGRPTRYARAK